MSSLPGELPQAADASIPSPTDATNDAVTQPRDGTPAVPAVDETTANDYIQAGGEDGSGASFSIGGGGSAPLKKRKKGKRKGIDERGDTALNRYRGTGFEEYYADPPLTPNEHWEEQNNIYTSERSFEDRIEDCIQRYRARRRMDNERSAYFTRYLMLGGVDTTQRQFTGNGTEVKTKMADSDDEADDLDTANCGAPSDQLSEEQKKRLKKGDAIRAQANDVITQNPNVGRFYGPGAKGWVKGDFESVAAGFLSSNYMDDIAVKEGSADVAISTIINFLKYVLQHDVCKEYEENIKKAWAVCEKAKVELPLCAEVLVRSPGDFNAAARILYCTDGTCEDCTVDPGKPTVAYREPERKHWEFEDAILVPKGFDARRVFMATIALQGGGLGSSLADRVKNDESITVDDTYVQDYEIVDPEKIPEIDDNPIRPDDRMRMMYAGIKDKNGKQGTIKPVGMVVVRPCIIEDGWDNRPTKKVNAATDGNQLQYLYFEDSILELFTVGMKLRLIIRELSIGLKFVKQVLNVLPSFYTFLPQELMLSYKEPRLNERPPPSIDDPDMETRALEQIARNDAME